VTWSLFRHSWLFKFGDYSQISGVKYLSVTLDALSVVGGGTRSCPTSFLRVDPNKLPFKDGDATVYEAEEYDWGAVGRWRKDERRTGP
jgi:hypothetical protein